MSRLRFGPYTVETSREGKIFFPEAGLTKGDLIDYYRKVAKVMLVHTRNRPVMMQRFPDGIDGEGFYQKEAGNYFPDWLDRAKMDKEGGTVVHPMINKAATLVYLADQACITPHLWLGRRDRPRHPDRLVFDLDPPGDDFAPVRWTAVRLRDLLAELELPSWVMTTGSKGAHVVVVLDRSADFETVRGFAGKVATLLARRHPDRLTTEQRKEKRGDRLFLDVARNAYAQTAVAPYGVRALSGAPVATPLDWEELAGRRLHARSYTLVNLARRLGRKEDPWRLMGRYRHGLERAREILDRLEEREKLRRQVLGRRGPLKNLRDDPFPRDEVGQCDVLHTDHAPGDDPGEWVRPVRHHEGSALERRLERRGPGLDQRGACVAEQRTGVVDHREVRRREPFFTDGRSSAQNRLYLWHDAAHAFGRHGEEIEMSLDLLASGSRQQCEDRAGGVELPPRTERLRIVDLVRAFEQRVADEAHVCPHAFEQLDLEGEDHGDPIGVFRELAGPGRFPRPDLWRDVVQHR